MYFLAMIETDRRFNEYRSFAAIGYFETYEEVIKILQSDYCSFNETCYDYAIVEQIHPDLYLSPEKTIFFKYDPEKNGYFEIEKPKIFNHLSNFALAAMME